MLFNSLQFLIFFPVVVIAYFILPQKYRWVFLLACNYYFYMSWKPEYALLILTSTIVDYFAALHIHRSKSKKKKKIFLGMSLLTNLGLLFTFKYFNFFNQSIRIFLQSLSIQYSPAMLNVILPVGISFYTFQTLGYTIDVYKGKIRPEKHFGVFANYVSFFPQLVAGPIERAKNLIPQFFQIHQFNYIRVRNGLRRMLWGFFKKVVIADRLAILVNATFDAPLQHSGLRLTLGVIFFSFQIYCDFSGYSDIAIGAAKIMGFKLMENFRRPYFSRSPAEFWRRWHISLSSWFRDYVYIPLGGNKVSNNRWGFNILVVFAITGLWHGASSNFVIWGLLYGILIILGPVIQTPKQKLLSWFGVEHKRITGILETTSTYIMVTLLWIFFRVNSLEKAISIFKNISPTNWKFDLTALDISGGWVHSSIAIVLISILVITETLQEKEIGMKLFKQHTSVRWIIYSSLLLSIILLGVFNENEFIYFQF